ncbi:MAG: dynamin family protein [Acidobacteriota bacterium]|nr:MAG: dynamin family protein [Acidobacteriota bacterium]
MTLARILTKKEESILADNRRVLSALRLTLERVQVEPADAASFDASIRQLDELFLLVVAGEFNAGKSAFINALVGANLLDEGVTPTTSRVTILKHGESETRDTKSDAFELVQAPLDVLENVNIVDTPGTNAIQREHEELTREFLPRSDMVLFVTSADRPFTETERSFLEGIRAWGKKVAVVVNKIDILDEPADVDEVTRFVRDNAATLLGTDIEVFPVSAKQAALAKSDNDARMLETSRFSALEDFIVRTLDDRERVRLKLLNPLGVGKALSEKYAGVVAAELDLLGDDLAMLRDIDAQLEVYERDQHRDFAYRLSDIDNALLDFENRGASFFEETLRLGRVFDLINKAKIKSDFEKKVIAELPKTVERRVEAVIDWMVESELEQWKAIMTHLDERRKAREDRIVGKLAPTFVQDRKRLLETVGTAAREAIDGYDRDTESTRLAESVQTAVASTALLEVGALGLGALVAAIATTTAADVTGILAASALSIVGLLVLPAKRRAAKTELNKKVSEVREQLMSSLRQQFETEIQGSLVRIQEAMAPYTRFVRAERDRLETARSELRSSHDELARVEAAIAGL